MRIGDVKGGVLRNLKELKAVQRGRFKLDDGSVRKRQDPAKNCLEAADQQQLSSILRVLLFGLSRAA
jgi:hypothetical protein